MELRDGSVRKAYPLPAAFPPGLPACAHAVAEDGGWHAYVAAVTRGASPRLLMWRFEFTWPFSNETLPLLDVPLAALGIMTALQERERTGEGQWVQSNLLQAGITLLDFQAARYTMAGEVPPQVGNDQQR